MHKCKFCKKLIKITKQTPRKRIFCNQICCNKYHLKNNREKYLSTGYCGKKYKKIKYKKRYCLGKFCRGQKKFKSTGPNNWQCQDCLTAIKGCLDTIEITVGRSNKS